MAKTAIIVGARGQDGRLLQRHLRTQGYRLACIDRGYVHSENVEWQLPVDITRKEDVASFVSELQPDEIYHLAAIHHSAGESAQNDLALYRNSYEVNFFSLLNFLEAIRLSSPQTRIFYAASSHIFGASPGAGTVAIQDESTPLCPESVYAMTKADGLLACRQYRVAYQIFAAVGILFNHESAYRSESFLTKKVVRTVVDIKRGGRSELVLGDLSAEVDWGYAPDFVEAMQAILLAEAADEFIIATGVGHSVLEFVEAAFLEAGIADWKQHVRENSQNLKRQRRSCIGDASKLAQVTKWKPKTSFREMVRLLIHDELLTPRESDV